MIGDGKLTCISTVVSRLHAFHDAKKMSLSCLREKKQCPESNVKAQMRYVMCIKTAKTHESRTSDSMMRTLNINQLIERLVSYLNDLKTKKDESEVITQSKEK